MTKAKYKYKIGDVVMLHPVGFEKKPTKARLIDRAIVDDGPHYLIELEPFGEELMGHPGDDACEEKEIIGLA